MRHTLCVRWQPAALALGVAMLLSTTVAMPSQAQDTSPLAEAPAESPPQATAATPNEQIDTPDGAPPTPSTDPVVIDRGRASWYGPGLHGRRTASGERFDMHGHTAAHRTLPFGTVVRVQSTVTGKSVDVRINDRGPFTPGLIIDLSRAAARAIDLGAQGVKDVVISITDPARAAVAEALMAEEANKPPRPAPQPAPRSTPPGRQAAKKRP